MKATPIGAAMKNLNGQLALVVSPEWKDRLVSLLAASGVLVIQPARRDSRLHGHYVITQGTEDDFVKWTTQVCRLKF